MEYISFTTTSDKTGISPQMLRYMCNRGYLGHVMRHKGNRVFTPEQVQVLELANTYRLKGYKTASALAKAWVVVSTRQ